MRKSTGPLLSRGNAGTANQEGDNRRQLMSGDEPINSDETAESDGKSDGWYRDRAKKLYCVDGEIEGQQRAHLQR
jgi:hypothetical protein